MKTGKQNEEYKWRFNIKIQRDIRQNTQQNKILVNELGMMSYLFPCLASFELMTKSTP